MFITTEAPQRATSTQSHSAFKKLERLITHIFQSTAIPPKTASSPKIRVNRFLELPCSSKDRQKIHQLILQMAEENKFHLLIHQAELRELGKEIDHVHPLKFLSVILTDSHLKSCLKQIRNDYFKWSNFIDGLSKKLTAFSMYGQTHIYMHDFAKELGLNPAALESFFQSRRWADLVTFLID